MAKQDINKVLDTAAALWQQTTGLDYVPQDIVIGTRNLIKQGKVSDVIPYVQGRATELLSIQQQSAEDEAKMRVAKNSLFGNLLYEGLRLADKTTPPLTYAQSEYQRMTGQPAREPTAYEQYAEPFFTDIAPLMLMGGEAAATAPQGLIPKMIHGATQAAKFGAKYAAVKYPMQAISDIRGGYAEQPVSDLGYLAGRTARGMAEDVPQFALFGGALGGASHLAGKGLDVLGRAIAKTVLPKYRPVPPRPLLPPFDRPIRNITEETLISEGGAPVSEPIGLLKGRVVKPSAVEPSGKPIVPPPPPEYQPVNTATEAVKKALTRADRKLSARKKVKPISTGKNAKIKVIKGVSESGKPISEDIGVKYALVNLNEAKPSHIPDLAQPDYLSALSKIKPYDADIAYNERDYSGVGTERDKIIQTVEGFDPDLALSHTPDPNIGAPIIDEKGTVLGGNNRTIALATIAKYSPDKYVRYLETLKDNAESFGLKPSDVQSAIDKYKETGEPVMLARMLGKEVKDIAAAKELSGYLKV